MAEVRSDVIEALEFALAIAKRGCMASVAISFVEQNGNTGDVISSRPMPDDLRRAVTVMLETERAVTQADPAKWLGCTQRGEEWLAQGCPPIAGSMRVPPPRPEGSPPPSKPQR